MGAFAKGEGVEHQIDLEHKLGQNLVSFFVVATLAQLLEF